MADGKNISTPDLASDDLNAKGPVADKMEQVYGSPSIRRGVMGPEGLVMDRRILQNVHQATIRVSGEVSVGGLVTFTDYTVYTAFADGIGDASASNTGVAGNLTLAQCTADTNGFLHPDCPFICKAIGIAPASLVIKGLSAGSATAITTASGVVPDVASGSYQQAYSSEYVDAMWDMFLRSFSVTLQLQGESCTLDLGTAYTLPAGAGTNGGSFVANGNPLAEAYRFLPFYVKFPPGSKRNKPLTVVFNQDEVNSLQLDSNLVASAIIYMDVKVFVYGRLCTEEKDA